MRALRARKDSAKSIARLSLDNALRASLESIDLGRVLDVGAKGQPYREWLDRSTEYLSLDMISHEGVDIVGDIHALDWPGEYFDTVIMTEVLEHLHSPQEAVTEIHRLLKPGGICLLTTRFFHPYHPDPEDYYRFTGAGLRHLCRAFAEVDVQPLGNRAQTLWLTIAHRRGPLLGRVLGGLTPLVYSLATKNSPNWASGFLVLARKAVSEPATGGALRADVISLS
jgi:SAM-dependent methyltransferase